MIRKRIKKAVIGVALSLFSILLLLGMRFLLFPYERQLDILDIGGRNCIELVSVSRSFVCETYLQCRFLTRGIEVERQTVCPSYDTFFDLKTAGMKILGYEPGDYCLIQQEPGITLKVFVIHWKKERGRGQSTSFSQP